jgi:hypothetical protein
MGRPRNRNSTRRVAKLAVLAVLLTAGCGERGGGASRQDQILDSKSGSADALPDVPLPDSGVPFACGPSILCQPNEFCVDYVGRGTDAGSDCGDADCTPGPTPHAYWCDTQAPGCTDPCACLCNGCGGACMSRSGRTVV